MVYFGKKILIIYIVQYPDRQKPNYKVGKGKTEEKQINSNKCLY